MWNDIDLLTKFARFLPLVAVSLVFLGGFVQLGKLTVDKRIHSLERQQKATAPELDAQVALSDKGNLFVVIESKNHIPFMARWVVVTEKNKIVSGFMTSDVDLYPTRDKARWQFKADISQDQVVNDFVELRLDYRSVHSAEMGYPKGLEGKIVHKYRLVDGCPQPTDNPEKPEVAT